MSERRGFLGRLKDWRDKIEYDLTKAAAKILAGIVFGAVALGVTAVAAYAMRLTRGLTTWERGVVIGGFIALLVLLAVSATWAVVLTWVLTKRSKTSAFFPSLGPVRPPLTLPPVPPRPDLKVELIEVLFRRKGGLLEWGWHVLFRLRVTNVSPAETMPALTEWSIEAGSGSQTISGKVVEIPDGMVIGRRSGSFGSSKQEEIERPSLDRMTEKEGLRRGQPKTGWILFDIFTMGEFHGPHNAEFRFTIIDALGGTHVHSQPAEFHKVTGDIEYRKASATEVTAPS